jgi:hypothetical protein
MSSREDRALANALGDLVRDRAIEAQELLDETLALEQMGIPRDVARDAIELPRIDTPASRAWSRWDGRGPFLLHGAADTGKTHEAALWARRRRAEGRATGWISCAAIASWDALERALGATSMLPAVVVDELGAGLSRRDGFAAAFEAWLLERGQRATAITTNADGQQVRAYLGARILSRMRQAGRCEYLDRPAGLRRPSTADPETGRSARYLAAEALVEAVGVDPDDAFDEHSNRVVLGWRVGARLSGMVEAQLRLFAREHGISWTDVEARARRLLAAEDRYRAELGETLERLAAATDERAEAMRRIKAATPAKRPRGPAMPVQPVQLPRRQRQATPEELLRLKFKLKAGPDGFTVMHNGQPKSLAVPTRKAAWALADSILAGSGTGSWPTDGPTHEHS